MNSLFSKTQQIDTSLSQNLRQPYYYPHCEEEVRSIYLVLIGYTIREQAFFHGRIMRLHNTRQFHSEKTYMVLVDCVNKTAKTTKSLQATNAALSKSLDLIFSGSCLIVEMHMCHCTANILTSSHGLYYNLGVLSEDNTVVMLQ